MSKQKQFFSLSCEWDIGQEHMLFTSEEAAYSWAKNNANIADLAKEDDFDCIDEYVSTLIKDGLLGTYLSTVIS